MLRTRHRNARSGFSIIEALIAAAILLIIAIGVLPLFTRALTNNLAGDESTRVSNFSKSAVEDLVNRDFNHVDLLITTGSSKIVGPDYWQDADKTRTGEEIWTATPPAAGVGVWQREVEVRQFSVRAFEDLKLDPAEALPAGADVQDIHFKVSEARVQGIRQAGPLESSKRITVRTIKSQ